MRKPKKVAITTSTFAQFSDKPLKMLEENGFGIIKNDLGRKLNESETKDILKGCDAVIAGTELYSSIVIEENSQLKVISRLGVGLDNIDFACTKKNNITVLKTDTTPARAVAELALGLIMDLLRNISYSNNLIKEGIWEKHMGVLFSGKTLGIIGLGSIGKELVKITKGFGLKYLVHDLQEDKQFAEEYNLTYCDLDTLLRNADVVSVHINMMKENNNLLNSYHLEKMKRTSIFINTSRGEVIDENDLEQAISNKVISGAALDVFKEEPYKGSLLNYNNIITTPHISSYAKEIRIQMEQETVENIINYFKVNNK
jgi:D-3-phosphoglycerate dehydrogenase / 2-oxoglutarate reductase